MSPRHFHRLPPAALSGLVWLLSCAPAHSTDLGVIGPTYAITEPHLLKMIEQRLREKERSGELKRLEELATIYQDYVSSIARTNPEMLSNPAFEDTRMALRQMSYLLKQNAVAELIDEKNPEAKK